MDSRSCDECRAIYRELRDAFHAARERLAGQEGDSASLAEWVQQLDEDECARMRETSGLWKAWRRWQEHRARTGHAVSLLPLPPDAISNPN